MEAAVKIIYSPEEQARQEIRSFVNEGLKDVGETAYRFVTGLRGSYFDFAGITWQICLN